MLSFQYTPIAEGEIRLLTINTTTPNAREIDLSISTIHLNDPTDYLALSYTWGDENDRREISLNGHIVTVTSNLFDALDSLRKRIASASFDFDVRIWVDAICINQKDSRERNQQVARMRDIFAGSRIVWAFIGTEKENDAEGFKLFTAFARTFQGLQPALDSGAPLPEESRERIAGAIRHPGLQVGWKALSQLLTRPWWTRAWIVQEIALAKSAIFGCGELAMDISEVFQVGELLWAYLSKEMKDSSELSADRICEFDKHDGLDVGVCDLSILSLQNRIQRLDKKLESMERPTLVALARDLGVSRAQERAESLEWTEVADFYFRATHQIPGHTLSSLLARFKLRQCRDPRDKIYALLGLARPFMEPCLIPVDYDLPVPVLWRSVVRAHLELYGNLDILSLFSGLPTPPSFSSWAHECTEVWAVNPVTLEVNEAGVKFKASMDSAPQIGLSSDAEESLSLKGVMVDVVMAVGPVYDMSDPSYIDSVSREIERHEGLQDLEQAHFHGFDGLVLEEWKRLAGVRESFDNLKGTLFSLQRDQDNDVVLVESKPGDKDDKLLFRGTWTSLNESAGRYPTGQANLDAFIQTLMVDPVECLEYAVIFHARRDALQGHRRGDPFKPMFLSAGLLGFRFYVTSRGITDLFLMM